MSDLPAYQFRYFFDPGSGVCLWSANDAARARFGYPVALDDLVLPAALDSRARELISRFDTSIAWDDPAAPSPWSASDRAEFAQDAAALLAALRDHMGDDAAFVDETSAVHDAAAAPAAPAVLVPSWPFCFTVVAWCPILLALGASLMPDAWFCLAMNPGGSEFVCGPDYTVPNVRFLQDILLIAGAATLGATLAMAYRRRLTRWGTAGLAGAVILAIFYFCSLVYFAGDSGP